MRERGFKEKMQSSDVETVRVTELGRSMRPHCADRG